MLTQRVVRTSAGARLPRYGSAAGLVGSRPQVMKLYSCSICHASPPAERGDENHWRVIDYNGQLYYVCPVHLPPDGSPAPAYQRAYERILAFVLARHRSSR